MPNMRTLLLPILVRTKSDQYIFIMVAFNVGRTFPAHPFFSTDFKYGQTQLYNILHTYSVHDKQVGYCQGMNFVAGTLLTHV